MVAVLRLINANYELLKFVLWSEFQQFQVSEPYNI